MAKTVSNIKNSMNYKHTTQEKFNTLLSDDRTVLADVIETMQSTSDSEREDLSTNYFFITCILLWV